MSGKAYVIVGATGTGKSTLIKERFVNPIEDKERLYIFDYQNEYDVPVQRDFEAWESQMPDRRNSLIIVEEATINLGTRMDSKPIRETLVNKRHDNNIIVFAFHAMTTVPNNVARLADGWYIFPTMENPGDVRAKYKSMTHIYNTYIQANRDLYEWECYYVEKPKPRFRKRR